MMSLSARAGGVQPGNPDGIVESTRRSKTMEDMDKIKMDLLNAGYKIDELSQWKSQRLMDPQHALRESELHPVEHSVQLLKTNAQVQQETAKRKQAEKQLRSCRTQVRTLTSELRLSEERERHRLAQDLHDTVAQCLAGCRFKLESLQADLPDGARHTRVGECIDFIDQAIKQTRLLMFEFYPWILDESGLETTLRSLAHRVQEAHGIQVECTGDGTTDTLGRDLRVLLFRTIRELLINVVKHAQARHVTISISSANNQIRINVVDDGIGFDTACLADEQAKKNGFGLISIRERLGRLGGRLKLISNPGQGTRAAVVIPGAMESKSNE
jgi:signal transduction histidine kinase